MEILRVIEENQLYAYLGTFLWTFLEGETFVLFAGLAARQGALRLDLLIACAWLGSFMGDQMYFALGRRYGQRLLERFPRLRPGVQQALGWLEGSSTLFILTYRFIYGVRNFSSVALGMSSLPWPRFLFLNFFAAGIWACSFAGTGYLFGEALGAVLAETAHGFLFAMLALFVTVVGVKVLLARRRRRRALAQANEAVPPTPCAPARPVAETRSVAE